MASSHRVNAPGGRVASYGCLCHFLAAISKEELYSTPALWKEIAATHGDLLLSAAESQKLFKLGRASLKTVHIVRMTHCSAVRVRSVPSISSFSCYSG